MKLRYRFTSAVCDCHPDFHSALLALCAIHKATSNDDLEHLKCFKNYSRQPNCRLPEVGMTAWGFLLYKVDQFAGSECFYKMT